MSGYLGNPDAESEQALIFAENGVHAIRSEIEGPVLEECVDCGDEIPADRQQAMLRNGMKCLRCVSCQSGFDKKPRPRIKMLDRIL